MVKLSVSKVARILGISRSEVQQKINSGILQTHEGYVTTDSVRLAYPNFSLFSEQDSHIKKINNIRIRANKKSYEQQLVYTENEKQLLKTIEELRLEITKLKKQLKES